MQLQLRTPSRRGRVFVPGKKMPGRKRERAAAGIEYVGEVVENRRNLTASAVQITSERNGQTGYRRLSQPWQDEAMANYSSFGECRGPATFYADTFSQVRIFPAKINPTGVPEEIDDAKAVEILRRVRDRSGGFGEILGSYGKLQFLVGDGYLTATGTGDSDDPEVWEYLSPQELRVDAGGNFVRVKGIAQDSDPRPLVSGPVENELSAGQMRAWRLWRRSPAHSLLADSPMRSVLDLFEELGLLQAAVRARVKSRLASAGILLVPEEISFPDESTEGEEDPELDIFTERLIEHMTQPIENEGTASAVTPFILRAAEQYLAAIRHIKLHDPNETYRETGLRLETIKRIAIGLDIPPEILIGMSDSNHWTAWMVDEQVAKAHIYPLATMFSNDLASAYFRPAVKAAGITGWQDLTVWYDATPIVVHPNRAQDAKDLYDKIELSGDALRKHTGFTDKEAPSAEERAERIAREKPARPQDPSEEIDQSSRTGDEGVEEEQPQSQPQFSMLVGLAEFAVDRARQLAGNRARRYAQSCPECVEMIRDVDPYVVVSTLGSSALSSLDGVTPKKLVDGAASELVRTARRLGVSQTSAAALGEHVESYAARTLFDEQPAPLPPGFHQLIESLDLAA
jgi:hypothetical protein